MAIARGVEPDFLKRLLHAFRGPRIPHKNCRTLARVVDALRQEHGEDVVLRSHNLRLRKGPKDAATPQVPAMRRNVLPVTPGKARTLVHSVPLNIRSFYSFLYYR